MLHTLGWFAIILLGLFFAASGACMLISPQTHFQWLSHLGPRNRRTIGRGHGTSWKMIQIWTRIRGAMLLAAMVWVAYQVLHRIR